MIIINDDDNNVGDDDEHEPWTFIGISFVYSIESFCKIDNI